MRVLPMVSSTQPTVPSPPQQITLKFGTSLNRVSPCMGPPVARLYTCEHNESGRTYSASPATSQTVTHDAHLARVEQVLELAQQPRPLAATALGVDEHEQRPRVGWRRDLEGHSRLLLLLLGGRCVELERLGEQREKGNHRL